MINKIHNEGCRDTLDKLDQDIDLTVTSPPYNVDNDYDVYDDKIDYRDYLDWLENIFLKVQMNTKEGGRLVVNIGDGKNGQIPVHSDLIQRITKFSWKPITSIIWNKKSTSNRCAWGSWSSPSCPSFPRPYEYILIFGKNTKKLQTDGETDITDDEFKNWAYGIWEFPGESNVDHPAPFPEELPKRCIKMLSWKNSLVYDPFAGSGTTLKVANDLGRDYIGSEISSDYCDIARERINK